MLSAEFRSPCKALIACVALLAPGIASAAIVVASSGPSATAYPVGRKLDDAGSITLRAGDTLTVLDAKGTRVLRGAGTFPVAAGAGAPNKASTFAVLTMQRSAQRVRTGAVRAGQGSQPPGNPNLWFIDVTKPAKRCVVAGAPVRLWRLNTDVAQGYSIRSADGGARVYISFPPGAMVAAWDTAKLPVAKGRYELSDGAGKPLGTFELAVLPNEPATAEAAAAALIEQGCTAQLDLLTSTLAQP